MAEDVSSADIDALPPRAAAAAIALGAAGQDPAVARDAALYLRKQVEIADLQIADMRREDQLRHWSVVVRHTSDLLRLSLELALAVIVLGFVGALASAIWIAAHDDSLVIEPFSVPPQMQQSGLTGQAVAAQLQDKLAAMQEATNSSRPAKSYANSWGDGIKVMIPDTGISIGDLYRTLAGWFGHQVHITGEVYGTKTGISITTRSNGTGGATVSGNEADFDSLLQKSAEAIYRRTQPYRYAVYVGSSGRQEEAFPIFQALAEGGGREDQLWAHMGISTRDELTAPLDAPAENRKALAIDPDFLLAWQNIGGEEQSLGHPGAALAAMRMTVDLLGRVDGQISERASTVMLPSERGNVAFLMGDYREAVAQYSISSGLPDYSSIAFSSRAAAADGLSLLHEPAAARSAWAAITQPAQLGPARFYYPFRIESDAASGDWSAVLADQAAAEQLFDAVAARVPILRPGLDNDILRQFRPFVALAQAARGDFAAAQSLISTTPLDCYNCLRLRGQIEALQKHRDEAARWFARAVGQSPDIPFAYADWGAMLMAKGDLEGGIAKFTLANQKGPHFADPLEMWGEALMLKNRSDLALAKFEEAAKYAPNWGRLHLKWGEALFWSGNKDEAKKHFALASGLDISAAERSELAKARSHD
jgi:tetratricopeptide (TPR) repeat protein